MRMRSIQQNPALRRPFEPTLPRGTGFLIVGAVSAMLWGLIVGVAVIF